MRSPSRRSAAALGRSSQGCERRGRRRGKGRGGGEEEEEEEEERRIEVGWSKDATSIVHYVFYIIIRFQNNKTNY